MGRRDRRRENDRRCDSWQTTPAGALDDQQRPRSRGRFALEPSGREVRAANEPAEFVEAPQGACLALERIGRQARSLNGVIAGRADPSGFAGELPRNPPAEACWRSLQRHDERGEIGHRFGVSDRSRRIGWRQRRLASRSRPMRMSTGRRRGFANQRCSESRIREMQMVCMKSCFALHRPA